MKKPEPEGMPDSLSRHAAPRGLRVEWFENVGREEIRRQLKGADDELRPADRHHSLLRFEPSGLVDRDTFTYHSIPRTDQLPIPSRASTLGHGKHSKNRLAVARDLGL